jgi:S-methylmethionine-dependent homocysteine/selenocysteine methylase
MQSEIILIDGGTSLELLRRSENKTPKHWSAEYLMTEPDLVRQVHLDYILAGAKIITTNTYSASFTRMAMVDAQARVPDLQRLACQLARESREAAGLRGEDVRIAGCLPPLNGPYVDFFLCETLSTIEEARAAIDGASVAGLPIWLGLSLMDRGPWLRSAEPISAAIRELGSFPISALLANCCPPETIRDAIPELVKANVPVGGYANGFVEIPTTFLPGKTREQLHSRKDLDPKIYADHVDQWIEKGARIVGGCCEVGPPHIAEIAKRLTSRGYKIVSDFSNQDTAKH